MASQYVYFVAFCILTINMLVRGVNDRVNERPIIGILAQGSSSSQQHFGKSYISASYVKYVESAGARVVPILVNQTDQYYHDLFSATNGVLFPGGGADIAYDGEGYSHSAHMFYKLALEANKKGDYYPVWATCLGFEIMVIQTAGKNILKNGIQSKNISLPVKLVPGYDQSRLLNGSTAPKSVINTLSTVNSTYNNHQWALTTKNFSISSVLQSFYQVLSTNTDANGVEFISMLESYDYPFYGSQWHPEKNSFEWRINACHSLQCVQLSQYFSNFFVEEARKSSHRFASPEDEAKHLIYNYPLINLSRLRSVYEEAYFFL